MSEIRECYSGIKQDDWNRIFGKREETRTSGRKLIVYRENKNGSVDKVEVTEVESRGNVAKNFHERVLDTYAELERSGQMNDHSPRQKQRIRDIHTQAQNPAYWGEKNTLGYTDGSHEE